MPRLIKPQRVKRARAIPSPSEEIVPRGAEQGSLELRADCRVAREERAFDRNAQRSAKPVGERDGKALLWPGERLVEFPGKCLPQDELSGTASRQLQGRWHTRRERRYVAVEQRRAQLDARAHAHFIRLLKERLRKLPVEVEAEQLAQPITLRSEDGVS